jgi:hypothetical protein
VFSPTFAFAPGAHPVEPASLQPLKRIDEGLQRYATATINDERRGSARELLIGHYSAYKSIILSLKVKKNDRTPDLHSCRLFGSPLLPLQLQAHQVPVNLSDVHNDPWLSSPDLIAN